MATFVDAIHNSSDQINPDQMYVKKKSEYNVKIARDTRQHCYISGICILPSGETIVADYTNKRVKMLDKHYNVSSDLEVESNPQDICQLSPCRVAVTFKRLTFNTVQFIKVSNGKLVIGNKFGEEYDYPSKLQLQHAALGITYHQGDLYITSGTALYHYTLTGRNWQPNRSLYEDTEGGITEEPI
ncbi:hypothetical protein DPMN_184652 [Dreissena polymorpha]|uniref:Uncharacterized protein n=1 Tax=Dreissena polymorpha TaxID=45954 RepID=A0A9D4DKF6_DREPO|nr:hypothetical protein DPMN_184652 [Dreissena polymorpha]